MLNSLVKTAFFLLLLVLSSCDNKTEKSEEIMSSESFNLFSIVDPKESGVHFANPVTDTREFNYLFYQYMYNGAGVAVGDINNDGLPDLYFSANQRSNKLYLNKGDFQFEDISKTAGIQCAENWSTGVSMIDINADGWLDIYVCNSASLDKDGNRANKLFINNGDLSFTESALEYGLADIAYSSQAYFLDYDKDGDLDMYLLNHRIDFSDNFNTDDAVEKRFSTLHSDKLYRNDNGFFVDVTVESGVLNHAWGLSASIGDFNNDGYEDVYVCNDFVQPDYLYINQKDGSFKDEIEDRMTHTSFYSMGSDFSDINNDGFEDLFVADMVSQNHERSIRNMAAMDSEEFERLDKIGYGKQYMFNVLQLNQGNGEFANISQVSGLSKTDWSWAPLIADFDNDGFKDIFITNGIKRDVTDIDFKEEVRKRALGGNRMEFEEVFNAWPATRLKNYAFRNNGDLKFSDASKEWGLDQAQNSNGAIYADLDADGDLDLVVNNIDLKASIYRNNSSRKSIRVDLRGPASNPNGVGAKVELLLTDGRKYTQHYYPNRGYASSYQGGLYFGISESDQKSSIHVHWPDGNKQIFHKPSGINQIVYQDQSKQASEVGVNVPMFAKIDPSSFGLNFRHQENVHNDFEAEVLLPQKQSSYGGCTCIADFNGDGLSDIFSGNSHGFAPQMMLQTDDVRFVNVQKEFWKRQSGYEDQTCLAVDYDGDGDMDLILGSAAYEVGLENELAKDRLMLNNGNGIFESIELDWNSNTSCIEHNGDNLYFFGARTLPEEYPLASPSGLFQVIDGKFERIQNEAIDELGIVNDAVFTDVDGDNDKDLIVVGEWMPVTIFYNDEGSFRRSERITNSSGWWNAIDVSDVDGDGDMDYLLGNLGENNKFNPSQELPFHVYSDDFDEDGNRDIVLSKQKGGRLLPARGRACSSEQIPSIKKDFPTYTLFGKADINQIYGADKIQNAYHRQVEIFSTCLLMNNGGEFELQRLESRAQFGPTRSFCVMDVDKDGTKDVIAVGNLYDAEAETIRYDANRGYVLFGDKEGSLRSRKHPGQMSSNGFYYNSDAREINSIEISGETYLLLSSNNAPFELFKLK